LHPEREFLVERDRSGAWRSLRYGEVLAAVRGLGQYLIDLGLGPSRPLALLGGNSVDHALLQLAAMHAGVPVSPVSPAYSLLSRDHAKLKLLVDQLDPGAIHVPDRAPFGPALSALGLDVPLLVSNPETAQGAIDVTSASRTVAGPRLDDAFGALTSDTIAKILFTSGSTGVPRGVVNTQRMLCSNQAAISAGWPFLEERPPVTVDWLPWSHTFGGNHNFFMLLWHGGTLYIDGGKPAPGAFDETLKNLREVAPTLYFNVPRAFDMLVTELERDDELARRFFSELDLIFYAAAALSQSTWERLERVSERVRGDRVTMVSAWGSTETSPLITQVHMAIDRAGVIGTPAPGCELAFVPSGHKLEMRVKGPNVTPGMWLRGGGVASLTTDERGFYAMGDAGKLANPDDPSSGVIFDGRTAENFKLASGTWVHVGELRIAAISACAPLVQDAVVTGPDREEVGLLLFVTPEALRLPDLPDRLRTSLTAFNQVHAGNSARVTRALVLREPASIDAGEITDKGYLNQRALLENRASDVARLYDGDDDVIVV
jgi:feruloyl-CoA synthase